MAQEPVLLLFKICATVFGFCLTKVATDVVFRRWTKSGKWAITSIVPRCPNCEKTPAGFRFPTDLQQAKWGGYTCKHYDTAFDKQGQVRSQVKRHH